MRLEESDRDRVGVLVDADSDIGRAWDRIRGALERSGYRTPTSPGQAGTIIERPDEFRPMVGVWLMPNNRDPGTLETFLHSLVPESDTLMHRAVSVVDGIPPTERRFPSHRLQHARLHTWLAWQEEPGRPFGQAVTKRYLDAGRAPAPLFASWLQRLFEADPEEPGSGAVPEGPS